MLSVLFLFVSFHAVKGIQLEPNRYYLNDLFERYMQICWQEKAQDWCTSEKTKIHLAFISMFCLLFNIPTFCELEWGAEGVKWTDLLLNRNYFIIYNLWIRLIIRCALPIICLVTLSSLVVIKVILTNHTA